jgi:hypothetical protein
MVKRVEIKFPKNKNRLKTMIGNYRDKILKDRVSPKKPEPIVLEDDDLVLKQQLNIIIGEIITAIGYFREKSAIIKDLVITDTNLTNMEEFYKIHSEKLNNNFNEIKDKEDINKRMVEFYNNDYDLKLFFKKYLKYIYNFLIFVLVLILLYKKLHKNKKILLFLAFLMIIPAFLLRILFDSIMKYIGHFKLDVLYSFFMFISVGIGYGGFLIVKKLLKMLQPNKPNKIFDNIANKISENKPNKIFDNITKKIPEI